MGIFDFLKKITKEKESESTKEEKITLSEIGNWIENKKKEIGEKEKNIFLEVKGRVNSFNKNIEEKVNIVKKVDAYAKRAEDKLKSATEEGRRKYLDALESFVGSLNNLQEAKIEELAFKVDRLFLEFNKISHMSYERATILIGKEMGSIKNEIKVLSKDLIKIFDEHKDTLNISRIVSVIETRLKKYEEIKKDEDRTVEKIASLKKEILEKEEANKKINEEIEKIKKGQEYAENVKLLEECNSIKEDTEKDFISLIQLIDFKALGNFYHIFEDKIGIVKSYRDKFRVNFEKDDGKEVSNLLNIAKLNTPHISDKIDEINSKREKLKAKTEEANDKTKDLYGHIRKNIFEIEEMRNAHTREQKRLEKFKTEKEEVFNEIKIEFEKIRILLIK